MNANDDLDSSDDEGVSNMAHQDQAALMRDQGKNKLIGAGNNIGQSKAGKFDKLLQKGNATDKKGVKLPSVFQQSAEQQVLGSANSSANAKISQPGKGIQGRKYFISIDDS